MMILHTDSRKLCKLLQMMDTTKKPLSPKGLKKMKNKTALIRRHKKAR